jgi:hypothetical protein
LFVERIGNESVRFQDRELEPGKPVALLPGELTIGGRTFVIQ